ncbi:hypothetical protein FB567DRAFT_559773 [Paraphoma chrysanthemicola]|uniref:Uncharacterized protein n=1 Tax=Paraphoma chrysanthemicola TaxID=798071 RepID=A0A8K0R7N6_9PLEO|nr:hypothetical protein FB567DRAFT_559773 [Paraphoma chrysanthemicola]
MLQVPPVWYVCKDLACPCNLDKCLQCEELMMALRRNPQRGCQEGIPSITAVETLPNTGGAPGFKNNLPRLLAKVPVKRHANKARKRKAIRVSQHNPPRSIDQPFPFFQLPRELRDQIYTNLVAHHNESDQSVIAATTILQDRKKRLAKQAQRDRLNKKRAFSGKPPMLARPNNGEPLVHLNLLQASHKLHSEATDCLYTNNTFAITLNKIPSTTFETPYGWALPQIKKLQLEIQLKDAAHMNGYVDWTVFFSTFTALHFLRIIPTFHPKYYDWASPELDNWSTTHYVHKAFFRELLAAVPAHIDVRFGPSSVAKSDAHLQGKVVSNGFLRDMLRDLGAQRNQRMAIDSL